MYGVPTGFSLYPTAFCPAYSAPEVIKAHIADSTEPEKESGFIYDPQPADIFSAFILILRMLGGDYPASWNFEGDDDDEYEDMERAILTYNDPTVRPSTCHSILTCLPQCTCATHQLTASFTDVLLLTRHFISMFLLGACPRMGHHAPYIYFCCGF